MRKKKKQHEDDGWVKLQRVAALFDVSPDFIRQNSIKLGIRTKLIASELRACWSDALTLRDGLLEEATANLANKTVNEKSK